jgi:hypothetical protein
MVPQDQGTCVDPDATIEAGPQEPDEAALSTARSGPARTM